MLILTAFHLFVPLRKRPHHLMKPSRDSRCCYNPRGPHTGGPRCPYLTVPGHPGGEARGPLRLLGPGLRATSSSRNPKSAGCAPLSHPTEAPFWRSRAPTQCPAPQTRRFQAPGDRCCARVPSRSPAVRQPGPKARTTGGRHRTQECRARGLAPAPGHRDGARRTGAPRAGHRDAPGSRARRMEPRAQPAARPASRSRRPGSLGAPRLPRCPARLPGAPTSRSGVGAL